MRKTMILLLVAAMILTMTACGNTGTTQENNQTNNQTNNQGTQNTQNTVNQSGKVEQSTIDGLEDTVEQELEAWVNGLYAEWEALEAEITTYQEYKDNVDKVEAFYAKILSETTSMCDKLRGYSVQYAEMIVSMDLEPREMYNEAEIIYDSIYDDAGDEIYDEIYNGLLDDMYDALYNGVVDDGYDKVPYSEWYDYSSEAYDMWSDTASDVYDECSDMRSDVYDFAMDFRGELFDRDVEKAKEEIADFKEDIE